MPIRFGSFCSGIGAPETAWAALGWEPAFFSEIEPFPCAVLAERFPGVPNFGDMTKVTDEQIKIAGPVDVVCAGTPCQSFSVAGLRKGMADPRGNLAFVFLGLIDRIRPAKLVWENVPGVLSSWSDEATFAPSEESGEIIREVEDARKILSDGGYDVGAEIGVGDFEEADQTNDFDQFACAIRELGYSVAWGSLDAQYFGLAQRRERVFVVGSLGDGNDSAAILFDRTSLSGNPPPSRETQSRVAASLTRGADSGGKGRYAERWREDDVNIVTNALDAHMGMGGPDDNAAQANHLIGVNNFGEQSVATALSTSNQRLDGDTETFVCHSLRAEGFDASEDGTGRGTPIVPVAVQEDNQNGVTIRDTAGSLRSDAPGTQPCGTLAMVPASYGIHSDALDRSGEGAAGNAAERAGLGITEELSPCLNAKRPNAVAQPIPIDMRQASRGATMTNNRSGAACSGGAPGTGIGEAGDPAPSISQSHPPAIAFQVRGRTGGPNIETQTDVAYSLNAPNGGGRRQEMNVATPSMAVRRLLPQECEKLQGFPPGFTAIPFRGKPAADGNRYKALGNSMAVPVLAWIGKRIEAVNAISR